MSEEQQDQTPSRPQRKGFKASTAVGVFAVTAAVLAAVTFAVGMSNADDKAEVKAPYASVSALPAPPPPPVVPRQLGASEPVGVNIPSLGIQAPMMELGLEDDGEMEVPPMDQAEYAGWYAEGPTPGEIGPAVIVGHLDSQTGPAVFARLPEIKPGTEIQVPREDGSTALFTVRTVEQVDKSGFPTDRVYGDTAGAELRVITCGGKLTNGHWDGNVIVYADLKL